MAVEVITPCYLTVTRVIALRGDFRCTRIHYGSYQTRPWNGMGLCRSLTSQNWRGRAADATYAQCVHNWRRAELLGPETLGSGIMWKSVVLSGFPTFTASTLKPFSLFWTGLTAFTPRMKVNTTPLGLLYFGESPTHTLRMEIMVRSSRQAWVWPYVDFAYHFWHNIPP